MPVSVGDVSVAQVCRQGHEVTRDCLAPCRALLQCPCCEGMSKVMDAWWACPSGGNPGKPTHSAAVILYRARSHPLASRRKNHVVIRHSKLATLFKVTFKSSRGRGVQGTRRFLPNFVRRICRTPSGSTS